ncbi:cation:proton antiporter [Mesorhizobium sp. VK25A]|uniref:Cation:proton antiporter n=1 Tax=Mesorhizobium vachelliae TaxID=3072309 RepID=A0ABU5A4C3_9HYPH|nr:MULTISPECIES: cation:proton antiporter [unclassified Mesorhizobium]MDX8532529.1 cation:proton antiporter [Mesorhizobium sp. VK25D]MDX8547825.1 cation:proton antiporter [Mesorhizobium sp. VK25A]
MENVWLVSAVWLGLALLASVISIRVAMSVALVEIIVGAVAGNTIGLHLTEWVNFLAGFGAILLTFLAGTEIDGTVVRKHFRSSMSIGVVGFLAPYIGVLLYAHYAIGWPWPQAQIAGISLSTTSVAVVYAVMVETGFNKTEMGKIILAACFINDLGTVLALGVVFAHFDYWLALFGAVTAVALWMLPRFAPWFFDRVGHRVSEPETKFISLVLLGLGGLATVAGSEAVLPAYLVGMALAPTFLADPELPHRMRIIAFTILTPFYFLKAGSLVDFHAVISAAGLIATFLAIKMATKFVGILPLTKAFRFGAREGMYTTLLMSTGLTFGTISALFGLTNHIIDREQYTILVTAVIGSALVPTIIAQRWFQPDFKPIEGAARPARPAEEEA